MNPLEPTTPKMEPVIGALRVVGDARTDAAPSTAALPPPPRTATGREDDYLFVLADLTGPASPHLYRELREVVAQTYWSTTGSITAALRKAVTAANRYLFQFNLHATPSGRCYGGLTCAVLHHNDVFILQAGPARACILHGGQIEHFRDEDLPHLGMGRLVDVRLYHSFVTIGDTLLLTTPTLTQEAGAAGLARVLPRADVQEIVAGLEQVGAGADFVALIARLAVQPATARTKARATPKAPRPSVRSRISARLRRETLPSPVTSEPRQAAKPRRLPTRVKRRTRPKPARVTGPSLGERLSGFGKRVREGARSAGRGIATAGVWLVGAVSTLFRRMLPGPEREAYRRTRPRRQVPPENRPVMIAAAVAIPVLLAISVAVAYRSFGEEEQFQSLIFKAEQEVALAEAAGGITQEARPHWEAALKHAQAAVELRPQDSQEAAALQAEIQSLLDSLDGVTRVSPAPLRDFGPSSALRQLVVHGQMMFVLDSAAGWVAQLTLNQAGNGVVEDGLPPPLVKTGQQVSGGDVSNLVDCTWVGSGGGRTTSGLLILEEGGALVSYDPAWSGEEGAPQLTRSHLGSPPRGITAVGSYQDRFYVMDPVENEIWRYEPQGDTYPESPDPYFVTAPVKPLETALDMAIDGSIYILYADGTVLKFLGGEPQPYEIRGVPDGIGQAVAMAVDPNSGSGTVYVADRGGAEDQNGGRVLVFGPDGGFTAQLCTEEAFDELEALAVDEAARRLYAFSGGQLYVAALP